MNRYRSDRRIKGGKLMATNESINKIKTGVRTGIVRTRRYTTKESERLDMIAAKYLGDGRLWWILAATSNIGWALQVPPGTILRIPIDLNRINALV